MESKVEAKVFIVANEQHYAEPLPEGAVVLNGTPTHVVIAVPVETPAKGKKAKED